MRRHIWTGLLAIGALTVAAVAFAQEETPTPAPTTLTVTEILLGTALENGVPTPAATSFTAADRTVYCMVRLQNPTGAEGNIRVAFERAEGEPAARPGAGVSLSYPARNRYRTFARSATARAAGAYRCVVRTEEGTVLSHADFQVTG